MAGESDLGKLLSGMSPRLEPGRYVFATTTGAVPPGVRPVATVAEAEGLTLVLPLEQAQSAGLRYGFVAARITLLVHSDLAAVGLTAAVSRALADIGVSCNVIAGYYHDHLFVPHERAGEALEALRRLATAAS